MSYNLNDNVQESFEFTLNGHTYEMKYPTIEETEQFQAIFKKAQEQESSDEVMAEMYKFISSKDEKAPPIGEIMKKQNVKVLHNFTEMIKAELGNE